MNTLATEITSLKLRVARAQLGTALHLFLHDKDPISVHVLASGGGEVVEGLLGATGGEPFSAHVLNINVDLDAKTLRRLRNQYWNAFKHFHDRSGDPRDDTDLLKGFDDSANDIQLFIGWLDYMRLTQQLPVAAQAFQVWWFALNPEKLKEGVDTSVFEAMFPNLSGQSRHEQKRQLRRAIDKHKKNPEIINHSKTDRRPLCLPR